MDNFTFGEKRVCAACGKDFYVFNLEDYIYRRKLGRKEQGGTVYFCGWNCMRAWEKTHKEPSKRLVRK